MVDLDGTNNFVMQYYILGPLSNAIQTVSSVPSGAISNATSGNGTDNGTGGSNNSIAVGLA